VKSLEVHGTTGHATIVIGESLENLPKYTNAETVVLITDTNVRRLYSKDFPPCEAIELGTGESIKDLDTVRDIYGKLVEMEADRSSCIVGIGGGIVCDIAGFVASTYLRGVRFGFVPTTLLSQVDAGVGGKNGVNFGGYKNMVGVFRQPAFVLCDLNLLKTLPEKEMRCGLAEIVKHAAVADADLFSYLEQYYQNALELDTRVIEKLIYDSVLIKASIVGRDERERGERRKLNFGHTFGHAIETSTGVSHGEAVSVGMVIASGVSAQKGLLPKKDSQRMVTLLKNLKLPIKLPFDEKGVLDAVRRDKKRKGDGIYFVVLHGIGKAVVEEIPMRELGVALHQVRDRLTSTTAGRWR
jgi:3-dehydroquinate synthase